MTGCPDEEGFGTTDSGTDSTTSDAGDTTSTVTTGATTTSDATASTSEPDEERVCVGAGPGSAPVSECGIDFCPPDALHVEADNASGGDGLEYEGGYPGFQVYKYRTGEEELTLLFDALPDAASTDAWLAENLLQISLRIEYPFQDSPPLGSMSTVFHSATSPWLLEAFAFQGGRFKMTAEIDVTEATQSVHSSEEGCVNGDVGGMCSCQYGGFTIPTTIAVDLSLDHGS
ncbi:hypothetical protein [Nannocystis radixulma]|uniref:Lipoprotein n=1 Tax=Nannocystis radixulma TaxID=2995305 RepID=A0ABT5B248_9BACT|nr:hypothetical protein [Nannocystis radixulma]MDC0667750.1 hypothetical protein [Nannocystis radixulma]